MMHDHDHHRSRRRRRTPPFALTVAGEALALSRLDLAAMLSATRAAILRHQRVLDDAGAPPAARERHRRELDALQRIRAHLEQPGATTERTRQAPAANAEDDAGAFWRGEAGR